MTSQPLQSPAPEYALLALLAAFWGSSYLLIKLALATIPPVTLIAIRVTIASLFLLAIMRLRSERLRVGSAIRAQWHGGRTQFHLTTVRVTDWHGDGTVVTPAWHGRRQR